MGLTLNKKRIGKKGSILDLISLSILFLVLFFVIIGVWILYSDVATQLEEAKSEVSITHFNESADIFIDQSERYAPFWDFLFVFIIFMAWIIAIVSAFILGNNPIFLVFYTVMSFALLVMAGVFETVLQTFIQNAAIAPYAVSFPITTFFIDHFLVFVIIWVVSMAIALYMKLQTP